MSRRNEVEIALSLQDRASQPLKRAGDNFKRFEGTIRDNLFAIGAVSGVALGAAAGISRLAEAAREGQVAQQQLAVAVENAGANWVEMEDRVNQTVLALERATAVGDADISRALTRLTVVTGDAERALAALPTVLDAAAISGTNVETVAGTLGRALAGSANTAESLGITFDSTATFAERLAQAQGVAGGAAEAAKTPADDLRISWENFQETLGTRLLPVVDSTIQRLDLMTRVVDKLTQQTLGASAALQGSGGLIDAIRGAITPAFGLTNEILKQTGAWGALEDVLKDYVDMQEEAGEENESLNSQLNAVAEKTVNYQKILAQSQVAQAEYNQSIQDSIAAYSEQAEAAQKAFEAMELQRDISASIAQLEMEETLAKVDQQIEILVRDIEALNSEAFESNSLVESANRVLRQYRQGLINAADAEKLLEGAMKAINGEIESQNRALQEQIALAEERIRQQERLTGRALTGPTGSVSGRLPPGAASIQDAFENLTKNALRRGLEEVEGGFAQVQRDPLTGQPIRDDSGGLRIQRRFTLSQFQDVVNDIFQQRDLSGAESILAAQQNAQRLLGFQTGGVVPGPPNSAHLAVVHGGEEVLTPQERRGRGETVVNNFDFRGSFIGNSLEFQRMVAQANRDYQRRGGGR